MDEPSIPPALHRSEHVDRFNHDEDAADYDADVRNESDPIRAGYTALLDWVAERAQVTPSSTVLELGSGTGNLTRLLPPGRRIVCVDVSAEMTRLAAAKLAGRSEIEFLQADVLEALSHPAVHATAFDAIVSTYTLHHLTEAEKRTFTAAALERLAPGGRLVVGDLMCEDEAAQRHILDAYRAEGRGELADEIEDEFFWDLAGARAQLDKVVASGGCASYAVRRFSELSWGLEAVAPG
ncbi:MAG: class I SAM-dependent methyltransferase [Acidobacteria bacterium]|nr:MAG: class I SAM-dependent methyltransferase [Acidobacteriota bacterium]REK06266.1 MAG: class I SAM-dependent methyltransferase [Acidobacteriota bacterium]